MHQSFVKLIAVSLFVLCLSEGATRAENIAGAIKKFAHFPVQTYEITGMMSKVRLEQSDLPPLSEVYVTGLWPDRKFLLIEFMHGDHREAYYVLYSSVEMSDQALWDDRMRASGNLHCLGQTSPRIGNSSPTTTAATKGFTSPCPGA